MVDMVDIELQLQINNRDLTLLIFVVDDIKSLISGHSSGSALERLVQLANDSDNSEVRYNAAGIIGQVALTCKLILEAFVGF